MTDLNKEKPKYSYNDIMVVPSELTYICSRSECNCLYPNGMMPIFTAPMDTVVGLDNYKLFEQNNIIPIIPRTVDLHKRLEIMNEGYWIAVSLNEFKSMFFPSGKTSRVLIDIANGHMQCLYEEVKKKKEEYDGLVIMVGNIANPETYRYCMDAGVDAVRCSIGTGSMCITSSNTAIGYPIASLISEIAHIKRNVGKYNYSNNKPPKIIADGGIRNYSDVIKAIALGADYVMCGGIFVKMIESSAVKVMYRGMNNTKEINLRFPQERYENLRYVKHGWIGDYTDEFVQHMKEQGHNVNKFGRNIGQIQALFYGMASKSGQIALNGCKSRTAEGKESKTEVLYTMKQWSNNMKDYFKSAMSYTNSKTIDELKEAKVVVVSQNAYNSVNK